MIDEPFTTYSLADVIRSREYSRRQPNTPMQSESSYKLSLLSSKNKNFKWK